MAKLDILPFKPGDYVEAVQATGVDHWMNPWICGQSFLDLGVAWTGRIDGRIAAVAGVMIPWPGTGQCWALWTPWGYQHPRLIHKAVVHMLRGIIRVHKLTRLDGQVVSGFTAGLNWAWHLGLEPEFTDAEGTPLAQQHAGPHGEDMIPVVWFAHED